MKKSLLFLSLVAGTMSFAQTCNEIFISEYVEGWSNNKALEIYNPTANAIDLSQYFVSRYSNGATLASAGTSVQLSGSIPAYGTYVAVLDKQDPNGTGQEAPVWDSLQAKADGFYCPVYNTTNAFYFNGNDALVLAKGTVANLQNAVLVDVFGKIGQDPVNAAAGTNGWSSIAPYNMTSGNPNDKVVTEDHSMIRKANVLVGKNSPAEVFGGTYVFNPLLQYDSIPAVIPRTDGAGNIIYQQDGVTPQWEGNWESLGSHTCNCAPLSVKKIETENVLIYPNPTEGVITFRNIENYTEILVFNSLGQKIDSINTNSKSVLNYNLGDRTGVYMIKLTDAKGNQVTKRIIVK